MGGLQIAFKTQTGSGVENDGAPFLYGDDLFIITDVVVGGQLSGKIEEQACMIIHKSFFEKISKTDSPSEALIYALEKANKSVLDESKKYGLKIAASVSLVFIRNKIMYFTHLGNSRIYCLQSGELSQLTRDHILLEKEPFAHSGMHDRHNIHELTKGLGILKTPKIEIKKYPLNKKDLIIMTTEGLTKRVSNREILILFQKTKNLEKLCSGLLDLAVRKGGNDKMAVGSMRYGILSREIKKIIILYSVLFLIILFVMGGYAVLYTGKRIEYEKSVVPALVKKTPADPIEIDADLKRDIRANTEIGNDKPVKRRPAQTDKAFLSSIYTFIRDWKTAWENTAGKNGDMDSYTFFYSNNFSSLGIDKRGWERDKAAKGKRKSWIRIELEDITVSKPTSDHQVEVRFRQDYRSSNYSTKSKKSLVLNKEGAGWKIRSEKSD